MDLSKIGEILLGSGPLALVLGIACLTLWRAYQAALLEQATFLKGLILSLRRDSGSHDIPDDPK